MVCLFEMTDTLPRNCLRVGYFISPCECKTTTDYEAQLLIGFGMKYLLGKANTGFAGLVEQRDTRADSFPSHRARPLENRVHRVQQRSIPMFFQNAPATFDGVVLAMVRRIVNQHDSQIVAIRKLHHPFDELRPQTGIVWTVVEIDHQLSKVTEAVLVGGPPLLQTVRDKITRLP